MNDLLETTGLACDLTTGLCGSDEPDTRRVTITYVTDPICSACWAMEPAWRTVQHRYGDLLDVRHVYGGLLPGWDGFADPANGIHGHEHVAEHWREMAEHTGQATAVSVWDTDPIPSSFPPSMVLVAARDVAPELAETALRKLREELFVHGRNIARPDVWRDALAAAGWTWPRSRHASGTAAPATSSSPTCSSHGRCGPRPSRRSSSRPTATASRSAARRASLASSA